MNLVHQTALCFSQMFTVSTPMGLVACLLANVIIPTIDVMSDLHLAHRLWAGNPAKITKRFHHLNITALKNGKILLSYTERRPCSPVHLWRHLSPYLPAGQGYPGGIWRSLTDLQGVTGTGKQASLTSP